jgi:RNA polymerase sigma-70 factor (ECF subfamily)
MGEWPPDQPGLLARLRDRADAEAWTTFVTVYAPWVYGLARRRGLQHADAADLTQDVLRAVVCTAPRFTYDPRRGSFRGWLFTVARNRIRKWFGACKRRPAASGDERVRRRLAEMPAPEPCADGDREEREHLLARIAEQVRPTFRATTWQAFWQTTVGERDAAQVGGELNLSVGAVYIARCRVLARLREQVQQLADAEDEAQRGEEIS